MTLGEENREVNEFTGPGFDNLRKFLETNSADSPPALATLDVAEKFAIGAVMEANGGIAGRLAADRRNSGRGNFRHRTDAMFGDENRNRATANEVTRRIIARQVESPEYAGAIEFLTTNVIRVIDRASDDDSSIKMRRLSEGLRAIVAEVCTQP